MITPGFTFERLGETKKMLSFPTVFRAQSLGEVTVICDKEEANFLFVNLFHDIVTGKRTVEEAKLFAAETEANSTFKKTGALV